MNLRKRLMAGLLIMTSLFMAVACTGCGTGKDTGWQAPLTPIPNGGQPTVIESKPSDGPTPTPFETVKEHSTVLPDSANVKTLGRTSLLDTVLWCWHSGSGVAFSFAGRECNVTLQSDGAVGTAAPRMGVFVDGELVQDVLVEGRMTVTIMKGEEDTVANIRIVKLSESAESICGIVSFDLIGMMIPSSRAERNIEFIGDSITCGYGVEGKLGEDSFSTATENVTKTYAYLTAQNLEADYSMVCVSGFGIVSGYTATGEKLPEKTISQYYEKVGFCYNDSLTEESRKPDENWDFSRFVPDTIVIHLGQNDASYCGEDAARCREFIDGYKDFLKIVRKNNPDALIVCTLGIMGTTLCESMETAVKEYTEESGDTNVTSMRFDEQNMDEDGIGVDWHPSEATHEKAAEKLTEFLLNYQ